MQPEIHLNWLAILAGVISNFVIGSLWYGPLFGKAWMKEMGHGPDWKPAGSAIAKGMLLSLVGAFFMSYVLAHSIPVWQPSVWGAGEDQPAYVYGFFGAFFSWIGFVVPVMLNSIGYEDKSWKNFSIGAGYQFVAMMSMGMILAYWH
jgi:hypothetical protein